MAKSNDWIYDQLLVYLSNPLFQIPVITFMEANCLIFDPSIEDHTEYRKLHSDYKNLVEILLEGSRTDLKLTHEDIITAFSEMNSKGDLHSIFQGLHSPESTNNIEGLFLSELEADLSQEVFEQVLASEQYNVFVRLMVKKNIELQQQALLLLAQTTGNIPDILQNDDKADRSDQSGSEREILNAILEQSSRDQLQVQFKDDEILQTILIISQVEASKLAKQEKQEQYKLEEAVRNLSMGERSPTKRSASQPSVPEKTRPFSCASESETSAADNQLPPVRSTSDSKISGGDAAANWIKSAQAESQADSHYKAMSAAAVAISKLSPEKLKKRQEFLCQQRDKLLAMKKKEREKQLLKAEQDQPQRPMSARAARCVLTQCLPNSKPPANPEAEKKLAMRLAIAHRIKAEVMGKK